MSVSLLQGPYSRFFSGLVVMFILLQDADNYSRAMGTAFGA